MENDETQILPVTYPLTGAEVQVCIVTDMEHTRMNVLMKEPFNDKGVHKTPEWISQESQHSMAK